MLGCDAPGIDLRVFLCMVECAERDSFLDIVCIAEITYELYVVDSIKGESCALNAALGSR